MKRYFFVTLQMDFKRLLYEKVAENSRYYCICSDYYIWVIDMDKCLCGYEIHSRTKWKWLFRRMYVYAYRLIVIWNVAEFCISNIPVYMSLAERRQTIKDWVIFIFKIIIAAIIILFTSSYYWLRTVILEPDFGMGVFDCPGTSRKFHINTSLWLGRFQCHRLCRQQFCQRISRLPRSQISKLGSGKYSITISTIGKVFRALRITTATLDLGVEGKIDFPDAESWTIFDKNRIYSGNKTPQLQEYLIKMYGKQ